MSDERHDEIIERVAASLRPLPEVDPAARARVLVAVAAAREEERTGVGGRFGVRRRRAWLGAGTLAAAALVALVLHRTEDAGRAPAAARPAVAARPPAAVGGAAVLTASGADAAAPVPVQLVFRAPRARRVAVVGDFVGWNAGGVALSRDSASGLWSVNLAVRPGRHVYAFLVDDTLWMRDPRAPIAPDADFGRPGSLLLVGRP